MPQIIFLTLYLGLIGGRQPVALQVTGDVASIRIFLDGAKVVTLASPPWQTIVDFGPGPYPRELAAVGYDAKGNEVARATQTLNVPRPFAEVQIVIDGNRVTLTARHFSHVKPKHASLKVDDVPLVLDKNLQTMLPALDMKRPHVVAAEIDFADDVVARREQVIGGEFGETMPAQLTAVALKEPAKDCFTNDAIHVTSIEKPDAQVILVRDPDNAAIRGRFLASSAYERGGRHVFRDVGTLDRGTRVMPLWPVAERVVAPDEPPAALFPFGGVIEENKGGLLWILTHLIPRELSADEQRRWADAVAVAGVRAMEGGRRRAVILVVDQSDADASVYKPVPVRKYLAAIGVPLFVWSPFGPRPDLAGTWGDVVDISSPTKLEHATEALRRALDAQRIAWVAADPVMALRSIKESCSAAR